MKWMIALSLFLFLSKSNAEQIFTSYEDYYRKASGVVFLNELEQSNEVYSFQGEHGMCGEDDSCQDYTGRSGSKRLTIVFSLTTGLFKVNGRRFSYERSHSLGEASNANEETPFHPSAVYFAKRVKHWPDAICIEGLYMGSGRFRMKDVFVILDPFGPKASLRFLHLPRLHASCKAIRQEFDGAISYPVNSYIWNRDGSEITGLMLDYFSLKDGKPQRSGRVEKLRFVEPGNPFEFFEERP